MKIALDNTAGGHLVKAYEPGRVQILDDYYVTSLIVSRDQLLTDWQPRHIDELQARHLQAVLEIHPEVLLLGTGDRQAFPEPETFITLMDLGIGFEVMDNAAACRTYNILLAEERPTALALILDGDGD
jgi:uncharacterized protein